MAEIRKGARKTLNKSELERWIDGKEALFGSLTKIEVAEGGTVGTFAGDAQPPDTRPVIILDPEGSADCPDGSSEVCRGKAYISGTAMKVLICR